MTDILRMNGSVEVQAAAGGDNKRPKRLSILAYSGGVMSPSGWGNAVIDLAGADVAGDIPILAGHAEDFDSIIGQGRATIRNGQLFVEGQPTKVTEAGRRIIALLWPDDPNEVRVNLQASVGFEVSEREFVRPGEKATANGRTFTAGEKGLVVIRAGQLREVSVVVLGADPHTTTIAAKSGALSKGMSSMPDTTIVTPSADANAETTRIGSIRASVDACQFADSIRVRAESLAQEAILAGHTPEQFNEALLGIVRASRPSGPSIGGGRRAPSAAILEAALLSHMGHEHLGEVTLGADVMQQGRELRCSSMMDILRAALTLDGREIPASRDQMIRAGFSTMSLPGILSNAAGKVLENAYRAFPSVARMVARILSAKDFKTHTGYRLSGDAKFEQVGGDGELKHGDLKESGYPYSVDTYGRIFGITRKNIIDDDLSAFDSVPQILGRGAAAAIEELFWTLVLANTGDFFHADNGNYIDGAGSALNLDGLALGVQTMLEMVDGEGDPLNVIPKFLAVPPALKAKADDLYRSTSVVVTGGNGATAERLPSGNSFFGLYQPLPCPYLSNRRFAGYSADAWYLFGDPADVAAFGIAFLNGQETPTIEQVEQPPEYLGIGWRGYADFGACQIDPSGAVKAKGTT